MLLRAHELPGRFAVALIGVLAALWVAVTLLASSGNSATFDEPVHVAASIAAVHGELGVNPEHPPLWKYVAGLPFLGADGTSSIDYSHWQMTIARSDPVYEWPWTVEELYREGARDGDALVRKSQYAMVTFGVLLIAVASGLTWRLTGKAGGALAAAIVAAAIALDPLVIAMGPIVSNDVAVTAMLLGVVWTAWELRRALSVPGDDRPRGDWPAILLTIVLGVAMGLAICTKYTGVVGVILAAAVLLVGTPRKVPGLAQWLAALAVCWGTIWAVYGFRYAPSLDGGLIDTRATAMRVAQMRLLALPEDQRPNDLPPPDFATRLLLGVERTRLFPQGLTAGLLMSYGVTRSNPGFAFGHYSQQGWWWYFPAAMAVKVPLGLWGLWGLGIAGACRLKNGAGLRAAAMGMTLLSAATLASPLNIGVRHAMPVMVLGSVLAAVVVTRSWTARWVRLTASSTLLLLGLETAAAFPSYLSFFNLIGRIGGPARLLSDSNLDWGQDLKRLGAWRRAHPEGALYLAYWGTADPRSYGLGGLNLPRTWEFGPTTRPKSDPAEEPDRKVAVSVTFLQGANSGKVLPFYGRLKQSQPIARIGETIYIFRLP